MSEIKIERIVNVPVSSNCYVLYKENLTACVIVDPGSEDDSKLLQFLEENNLEPQYIILTHHHFDHIWGVNNLMDIYACKLVCSKACSEKIIDKKLNLSYFYNDKGFTLPTADFLVEDFGYVLQWNDFSFNFYHTKGHSDSCISFLIKDYLFTGDALIKDIKVMTKFPGGSKINLRETYKFYNELLSNHPQLNVCAGHGEIFELNYTDLELI